MLVVAIVVFVLDDGLSNRRLDGPCVETFAVRRLLLTIIWPRPTRPAPTTTQTVLLLFGAIDPQHSYFIAQAQDLADPALLTCGSDFGSRCLLQGPSDRFR